MRRHGLVDDRTGKADQTDPQPGALNNRGGGQEQLAAFLAIDIRGQHRIRQLAGERLHPVRTKGEFPMERHGIEAQLGHKRSKSFRLVRNREMRPMEGVAIVQRQHAARIVGAGTLEDRLDAG